MSALLGYVPGKRLGLGEDMPAGVFREWSRWTTLPHYFFDDPTLGAAERYAKQQLPILALGFDDDPWANPPAIGLLVSYLTRATVERRQIDPHAAGSGPVGHMGFFRSRPAPCCGPTWPTGSHRRSIRREPRAAPPFPLQPGTQLERRPTTVFHVEHRPAARAALDRPQGGDRDARERRAGRRAVLSRETGWCADR